MADATIKVGFIGGGEIAMAVARGFIESKLLPPENIMASAVTDRTLEKWKVLGCHTTKKNAEVVKFSSLVVLSVKPKLVLSVVREIARDLKDHQLIVSVAAGIPIPDIEQAIQEHNHDEIIFYPPVLRVLPNTACSVKQSATTFCRGKYVSQSQVDTIVHLMSSVGTIEEIEEHQMDAVTSLCGSGIAYLFLVQEAMSEGGVKVGLPRVVSDRLAVQTMLGAARMTIETGKSPGQLKESVCSPAGTTIAGVHQLEKDGLRAALMNAVEVGAKRAEELGKRK